MSIRQSIHLRGGCWLGGLIVVGLLLRGAQADTGDEDFIQRVLVANDVKDPVPVRDVDRTPEAFHDNLLIPFVSGGGQADFTFVDGTTRVIEHVSVDVSVVSPRGLEDPYGNVHLVIDDPRTGRRADHILPLQAQPVRAGIHNGKRFDNVATFAFSSPMRLVLNPGNRMRIVAGGGDTSGSPATATIGISGVTLR